MPPRKKVVKIEPTDKEAAEIIKSMNTKQYLDKIVNLKKDIISLDKKIKAKKEDLSKLADERIDKCNAREQELEDVEGILLVKKSQLKKDRDKFNKEISNFKEEKKDILLSISGTNKQIDIAQDNIALKEIELSTKRKELTEFEKSLTEQESELLKRDVDLNEKDSQIDDRHQDLKIVEVKLENLKDILNDKNDDLKSKESMLKTWSQSLEKQDKKIKEIQVILDDNREDVEKVTKKLDEMHKKLCPIFHRQSE